jgi:hypothetical protein
MSKRWTEEDLAAYLRQHPSWKVVGQPASVPVSGGMQEGDQVALPLAEEELLGKVRSLALANGWLFYHTRDSRRSEAGFPDCVLVKPGRLIFAELKSAKGKPTHAQEVWLSLLAHSVPGVVCYLWRPKDVVEIAEILER